jgi:aldehyde dehydrogenase (NAD+)
MAERRPFIHGESRSTGDLAEVRSPFNGEVVTLCHRAGPRDVEDALASAASAFEIVRGKAAWERAAILAGVASEVRRRREELARILVEEAG